MPVRGTHTDYVLDGLFREAVDWLGDDVDWYDVHTHIGRNDPDGFAAEAHEIVAALDDAAQQSALVFPMHEPAGYRAANDEVLAACAAAGDRLQALARVDPNHEDALAEARRCLDRGARGIKLHPRSDGFAMTHPAVEQVVAEAGSRRALVLFHAGRGIPALGEKALDLAAAHPDARIVLAHAGISDLELLAAHARELPNLLFDTAWWHPTDVLSLLTTIPPGQVLYATDMPYGPPRFSVAQLVRLARAVGHDRRTVREMAGAQARRAANAQPLADLGDAPGSDGVAQRDLACERIVAYLTSAVQMTFRDGDPTEPLALARLASRGDDPVLAYVDRCIAIAQSEHEHNGPVASIEAALAAQLVASTPALGAPAIAV